MKNTIKFILTGILILLCSYPDLIAQEKAIAKTKTSSDFEIKLFTGGAIPLGDFASTSGIFAGYALPGFSISLEGSVPLSDYVEWEVHSNVSINKFDASEAAKYVFPFNVSAGSYYNPWFFTGLQIGSKVSNDIRIYASGDIGLLFSSYPDITFKKGDTTLVQTTQSDIAAAYCIGAGVQYSDYNFSIRYLTGTPQYSQKISGNGKLETWKAFSPNSLILIMVGITL